MLIGLSGWWTPFPHNKVAARNYVRRLIRAGIKDQTLRLETPLYKKIKVGDKLQLWWKKRGQPKKDNEFYGLARCTKKIHALVDIEREEIRILVTTGEDYHLVKLNEVELKKFCKRDMNRRPKDFFQILRENRYKSGQYIAIRWFLLPKETINKSAVRLHSKNGPWVWASAKVKKCK